MSAKIEAINPAKAKLWLQRNPQNRPKSQSLIDRYAGAMARGEWLVNGEAIILNCDGTLYDGQHRLHAVIQANVTIRSYVIRGVDPGAFDTINQGKSRSLGDVLARHQEKHYTLLAAAIRCVWVLGHDPDQVCTYYRRGQTVAQFMEFLSDHPELRSSVEFIAGHRVRKLMVESAAAALLYLMRKKDPIKADVFWEKVATGEDLSRNDPAYKLREFLIKHRNKDDKLQPLEAAAAAVIAWNNMRGKGGARSLRWSNSDPFPTIQ